MESFIQTCKQVLHPFYVSNLLLATSFYVLKTTSPFCEALFDDCELEVREWEMLTFLGCIIVLKNRKQPSFKVYMGVVCAFAKCLSAYLFLRSNPLAGVMYIILCLLHVAFLTEPSYKGPEYITYFRGSHLEDELNRDPRVVWLIEFYAVWQPTCVNFAEVFSKLSAQYYLENLKFGKIDVTRYPEVAAKFQVDTSSWTKQLPTIIVFKNGKELDRRPLIDYKGHIAAKFVFSEENVIKAFELNELYLQCKKNPIKLSKRRKADLNAAEASSTANGVEKKDENGKPKTE